MLNVHTYCIIYWALQIQMMAFASASVSDNLPFSIKLILFHNINNNNFWLVT